MDGWDGVGEPRPGRQLPLAVQALGKVNTDSRPPTALGGTPRSVRNGQGSRPGQVRAGVEEQAHAALLDLGGAGDPAWHGERDRVQSEGFVLGAPEARRPGRGLGDWRAPR